MSPSVSQDAVGRVVDDRYRLVAKIGVGPSAEVYLADDVRLRRRVTVKMLGASLAEEPAFVTAFGAEMQSASALRHPHIAMIHDWGIDEAPYVVGEYFGAGSLRDLSNRGLRLTPSQALQIALAAARALAYAHDRGVAHRDLRPSNLLFTDDGRLKIADFGLARAHAQAASTQPMGNGTIGVRYASPEQARGSNVDGAADVYALVLVIIEAVTGTVPFSADTALATVLARIDRAPEIPEELGAMTGPLARASAVDPAERLDAAGLVTALMAVADTYPEPEPLHLQPEPVDAGSEPIDERGLEDITLVVAPGAPIPETPASQRAPASPHPPESQHPPTSPPPPVVGAVVEPVVVGSEPADLPAEPADLPAEPADLPAESVASTHRTRRTGPGAPVDEIADVAEESTAAVDGESDRTRRNRRRGRLAWIVLALVVVVGGGAVGFLVFQAQRTPTHLVPSVTGLTPAQATTRLQALGFAVDTEDVRRDGTRAGQLLGVDPASGTRVAEGTTVTLTVSAGQTLATVPKGIVGKTEAAAKGALTGQGLVPGESRTVYSEDVEAGHVVSAEPAVGKPLEKGSTVVLVVSDGPKPRVVPSVSGMTPDQAKAALREVGLVPEVVERYDVAVDTGGLIGLEPGPGTTVPRGATVTVVVSKGLLVAVPDLGGVSTVSGAIERLQAAGLQANALGGSGSLSGRPVAFDPPAGQLVVKGSAVDIIVQ